MNLPKALLARARPTAAKDALIVALGPMAWSFVITGPPRTKKNHGSRLQRGDRLLTIPSQAYLDWDAAATVQLKNQKKGMITGALNCRARFYRHALVGDACGFYQALADTLQHAGVIVNDSQIQAWDGTRLLKDAGNPRVEFTLETMLSDT